MYLLYNLSKNLSEEYLRLKYKALPQRTTKVEVFFEIPEVHKNSAL